MYCLNLPDDKVKDVFSICISKVEDSILKKRYMDCINELIEDEENYIRFGRNQELYKMQNKLLVNNDVSIDEMKKVYTYRMVDLKQPGRVIYNKLMNSTQLCPICGVRDVSSLDHYLPKSKYASLVVTPVNLVPSCNKCNRLKSSEDINVPEQEFWHPYFDSFNSEWLFAKLIPNNPPIFEFYCKFNGEYDILKIKIANSFALAELKTLYSVHAAKELSDIEQYLRDLKYDSGVSEVKSHLQRMYKSIGKKDCNSWKYAMYREIKDNDWFINEWI